ncbi:hypothetical protein DTO271D3_6594 [Paecilomyces variotii]|nr:hypothetical protein DTO271D3_6594 [Paecilomyces variotii]
MPPANSSPAHPATRALHADDPLNQVTDVAPPVHLSTTYRYPNEPEDLIPSADPVAEFTGKNYIYSREFAPNTTRFETILSSLLHGHAISYSSDLAALHATLTLLNPHHISLGDGYHGSHEVISVISRLSGLQKLPLDCPASSLEKGDVILLETPINPFGTAFNIEEYAIKAHSRGAYLIVDSTFGPPGLQDPFLWGADIVLHSGSKYFGGHSDLLCGVVATKNEEWTKTLLEDRLAIGNVMGNLEGDGLRGLNNKTESESTPAKGSEDYFIQTVVEKIHHVSLQDEPWVRKQMPNGFGPVFSLVLRNEDFARRLPSKLAFFHHATSLGGVESLIEWRALSDSRVDRKLLRISVGLENWLDLKNDLLGAFKALVEESLC